jgi:hypothetical protein
MILYNSKFISKELCIKKEVWTNFKWKLVNVLQIQDHYNDYDWGGGGQKGIICEYTGEISKYSPS